MPLTRRRRRRRRRSKISPMVLLEPEQNLNRFPKELQEWIAEFPIGTLVWESKRRESFATTVGGRCYDGPGNYGDTVGVTNINGIVGNWGVWSRAGVIKKE